VGSHTITAADQTNGAIQGTSVPVQINANPNRSTLLNVTHLDPNLGGVVDGQAGVTLMEFPLTIPPSSGTDPVRLLSLTFNLQNQSGNPVNWNAAFANLYLVSGASVTAFNVSAVGAPSFSMPLTAVSPPFLVNPGSTLSVTLVGDIAPSPSVSTAQVSLANSSNVSARDDVALTSVGISTSGDSTGFPMLSDVMLFEAANTASTYGNYPNPFRAGTENTTIEFYLPSASTVSLVIYDVLGSKVIALADHQDLNQGMQRFTWDGRNGLGAYVINGVYYAQLSVNGTTQLLKIAVVK
jgi:hypothetical protein